MRPSHGLGVLLHLDGHGVLLRGPPPDSRGSSRETEPPIRPRALQSNRRNTSVRVATIGGGVTRSGKVLPQGPSQDRKTTRATATLGRHHHARI